jgi:hypothetical protein
VRLHSRILCFASTINAQSFLCEQDPVADGSVIIDFFVNNCALDESVAHSYSVRLLVDGEQVAQLFNSDAIQLSGFAAEKEVNYCWRYINNGAFS